MNGMNGQKYLKNNNTKLAQPHPILKYVYTMNNNKNDFQVYALTTVSEPGYTHWSEGLTMYIVKDGVTMKLNSDEVNQLVKALPPTVGGTY